MRFRRRSAAIAPWAVGASLALVLAGCSAPGSSGGGQQSSDDGDSVTVSAPITADQVDELGDVELNVWADQGEQQLMKEFVPAFEKAYPNVSVNIQFKSFNDLVDTVLNAMNSDNPPDVTQGNQGWATDGALVKSGLIRPLDDVVSAYGYDDAVGDAISQLQWSDDGSSFGEGSTYGMSPDNQMVGLFYNKQKLDELGDDVPATLDELEDVMSDAKDAGEIPLVLGNSDKASAMQAFSLVQGDLVPASETRDWILGDSGADFDTDENIDALERFGAWFDDGFVSPGYNGQSPDDAAEAFASGQGVFFIGGNWYAETIEDGSEFGFAPGFAEGDFASGGSFGMPWHVSSRSDVELAALAWVGMLNSAETAEQLVDVQRVPVYSVDESKVDASTTFPDLLTASSNQLDHNGALYWYDWSTNSMFDTFTSGLQEYLAGRTSAPELAASIQDDWDSFNDK